MAKKRKNQNQPMPEELEIPVIPETEAEAEEQIAAAEESDSDAILEGEIGLMGQEIEEESFLPEAQEDEVIGDLSDSLEAAVDVEGTELDSFESAEIEETEFIEDERVESIIESILFASDRPVGLGSLKLVFKGTNVRTEKIKRVIERLSVEYAGAKRGITLEEVPGGWQLRTKVDNMEFLRRTLKTRSFRLSGPALEVLSIVAYKQPVVKHEIDEIRGVESGHLLRALMEKNLVNFEGKSDLPGRPMQYATTRKFLEIFGLRNLKELPTLSQIDELLPEGIGEEDEKKQTLSDVTDAMAEQIQTGSFSDGEEELNKIQNQLEQITTSSDFFEQEKRRQRELKDRDRAQNIRDALTMDETVPTRDLNWLKKYDEALAAGTTLVAIEDAAKAAKFAAMNEAKAHPNTTDGEVAADLHAAAETAVDLDHPFGSEPPLIAESENEELEEAIARFEEDAPHPEDELPTEVEDIEGEDEGTPGEGHASL